ncbi:MAG: LysM peptidoglycan-binding domain-containing protein [Caldilineales bacterium]|nr:LysM peptidoglycan-binding domain-containing protein [Caldilineales bacterium]
MSCMLILLLAFVYVGPTRAADMSIAGYKLGCGATYRVRPGDTLSRIARRCGVTVAELQQANNLPPRARLLPGRILRIPRRAVVAPSGNDQGVAQSALVTAAAPVTPTPMVPPDLRKHYLPTPSLGN